MSPLARRRNVELRLGLLAVAITLFGYVLVQLAEKPNLPPDLWLFFVAIDRPLRGRALRRARARAERRPRAAAARRAADRHRVRDDLAARPRPRAHAGGVDGRRGRRVRRHAHRRPPRAHARALPLHVPVRRRGRAAAAPRCPASARRSTARASGSASARSTSSPARRRRCCSSSSSRPISSTSASCWRAARRRIGRMMLPRAAATSARCCSRGRFSILIMVHAEGPRVVAALLRGLRRDALRRDRARGVPDHRAC